MNSMQTGVGEVPVYISFPCGELLFRCRETSDWTFQPSGLNGSAESGFEQ